ncbi:MAG TPA: FecR domain-containing protein [Gemmatimonadales bacterium]|nr:FecR domain-containing protein [Gemmatimonadales bacterium]
MGAREIEEQAAAWLVREDSEHWSRTDEAARDDWIAADTAHRVAYLRLKSVWDRSGRLGALRGVNPRPAAEPRAQGRFRAWRRIAACLVPLAAAGAAVGYWYTHSRDIYRTPVGAHETIHLADGSSVELNTNTELRAILTPKAREVVLEQGEAFFQVVHDPAKPFVVLAGRSRITDLGTKFSVRREGDQVQVIVTQGRVKIENLDDPRALRAILAKPDMQVIASVAGTLVAARSAEQVQRALSWRSGVLVFDQETLAAAATEFNRYNRKQLVLESAKVAGTRIGGSFEATNVEAFARLLRVGFGFRVTESGSKLRVAE